MTELPTTFGKYYLTEKLATGGMAEIYLAKLIGPGGFEKQLVIKQIHPKLSGQRQFVDLFVAEAKTLVTLTHGNIVPVYELGVVDDTYFIAMDYIDGPTLYRLTETMARREAQMEPALAAYITARMLEGLDYAHRKGEGVIHRDLSPRNVMLSRDGDVKLVDFGIAVTLGEPGEEAASAAAPTGSFPYMSPEQVRREPLTGQTDLFSVGVLLWEMLAGQRLFSRPDQDATLAAVLRETIPKPSSVRPDVPAKLDEVVMRALERDQGARWESAADMLAALNKFLYSLDVVPGPRDVAGLVAKFCPPETRRLPTHLEAVAHDVISPEPLSNGPEPVVPSGPATAVIPRDQAARGKPQRLKSFATNVDLAPILDGTGQLPAFHDEEEAPEKPTKQDRPHSPRVATPAETPAGKLRPGDTVVESPDATPPPLRHTKPPSDAASAAASNDTPPPSTHPSRRSHPRMQVVEEPIALSGSVAAGPRNGARADAADTPATTMRIGQRPPTRKTLIIMGAGVIALAAASIWMVMRARNRVLAEDEAAGSGSAMLAIGDGGVIDGPPLEVIRIDGSMGGPSIDVAGDGGAMHNPATDDAGGAHDRTSHDGTSHDGTSHDGSSHDGTSHNGGARDGGADSLAHDGGGGRRSDAGSGVAVRIDAGGLLPPDAATGTAVLKIGADPWGEIYIDGRLMGRTPRELVVPAGKHTVEIVFPAETPPRRQTFGVDLAPGETKPLQADFSN